ncbi:hypothetical protein CALCODRAFT_491348 [Calocera cornea HHB12733]|uniref:F-box domain-containing protein n=1 Tax=Calocera cornea HHB12733 TaxID=1353952 RepID=A0A165J1T6_9BASI|nr:hypothetical protein CALCODRAFT_491348 [Calocera cornea HHB12733]
MLLVTTVTLCGAANREKISSYPLVSDAAALKLQHLLVLDLSRPPTQHRQRRGGLHSFQQEEDSRYAVFLARIKDVVRLERSPIDEAPPIDALCIRDLSRPDYAPGEELCRVVDGLLPRLLELHCGWYEYCDLHSFDILKTKFPLERLVISGACGDDVNLDAELLACVPTLHLDVSHALRFPTFPIPVALRQLIIKENDAMDLICRLHEDTHMLENLERLQLTSTVECDLYQCDFDEFLAALKETNTLRALELVLDHSDIRETGALDRLPSNLPGNIECFSLRGSSMGLTDSALWITAVQDRAWLPRLREFAFDLDVVPKQDNNGTATHNDALGGNAEVQEPGVDVTRKIREVMAAFRPLVRISEG